MEFCYRVCFKVWRVLQYRIEARSLEHQLKVSVVSTSIRDRTHEEEMNTHQWHMGLDDRWFGEGVIIGACLGDKKDPPMLVTQTRSWYLRVFNLSFICSPF